jgi:hypothetical protein
MDINNPFKGMELPKIESSPFVKEIGGRIIKGAGVGFLIGLIFFRRRSMRRFCLYYGAGFGLGMSYL